MNIFLIFIGGGIGSVARYLVTILVRYYTGNDFPLGVMIINIIGSFFIGLTYVLIKKSDIAADHVAAFIMVGVLGGFTTFSAFSLDVVIMASAGKMAAAFAYIAASVVFALLAAYLGILVSGKL